MDRRSTEDHSHVFDTGSRAAERGTRLVAAITAVMMAVEIWAGWWFNSMALLADGWHMSSHAVAIGLSAVAYLAARRYAHDPRFAFGTWKMEVLGGFASALFLLGVAAMMVFASVERLVAPRPIGFQEAIVVAVVGLVVNVVCAYILGVAHEGHDHGHGGDHHHDLNLRSAYLHVLADAATSVLAIVALAGGLMFGWNWLDPLMGIVGAALVAVWAKGLLWDTGRVLLDREMDHPLVEEIRLAMALTDPGAEIADLHVWRVGKAKFACIVSLRTAAALTPERVRESLRPHQELVHVTVEIQPVAGPGVTSGPP
jgi:cation diffusion facilitator family transporter